nr:DHH family phosphoesterase [Lachnospiraceae bacterium]
MKKWIVKNIKEDYQKICSETGLSEVTARLLVNRGLREKYERDAFLHPFSSSDIEGNKLLNAEKAADIICSGLKARQKMRIIGDYDVDGIVSTFVLYRTLKAAGADVDYRIPDRILDGYGINANMVKEAINEGVEMIITCDNGIAAVDVLALAKNSGITVVLTDHHEVFRDENGTQVLPP